MNTRAALSVHFPLLLGLLAAVPAVSAEPVEARLRGFREVPSVSTAAAGRFQAVIDAKAGTISYELAYSGLTGDVAQAHIHVGERHVNGGISVFLCQTEASADPTGLAPRCPQAGRVSGVLQAANMIGGPIEAQGIAPGEFGELVSAIRAGAAYVNVHSSTFAAGEVRGQIVRSGDED